MIEKTPWLDRITWLMLGIAAVVMSFPVFYALMAASLPLEEASQTPLPFKFGTQLFVNMQAAWNKANMGRLLFNSAVMALGIAIGKISISMLSAFAITYFNFKARKLVFWSVFVTLMLPVEVRILPTFEVAANLLSPLSKIFNFFGIPLDIHLSVLDSYSGLIFPLIASATATFLFRQFFLTIPDDLAEAAKIDGASPMQFFFKILLPLSRTNIAALFVIVFVFGWNQYLWPLLITTEPELKTAVIGIQRLIPKIDEAPEWNVAMAGALIILIPPVSIVLLMQKWFVKGLIENEK